MDFCWLNFVYCTAPLGAFVVCTLSLSNFILFLSLGHHVMSAFYYQPYPLHHFGPTSVEINIAISLALNLVFWA